MEWHFTKDAFNSILYLVVVLVTVLVPLFVLIKLKIYLDKRSIAKRIANPDSNLMMGSERLADFINPKGLGQPRRFGYLRKSIALTIQDVKFKWLMIYIGMFFYYLGIAALGFGLVAFARASVRFIDKLIF